MNNENEDSWAVSLYFCIILMYILWLGAIIYG